MKWCTIILCCVCVLSDALITHAQNLVLNAPFELYTDCPTDASGVYDGEVLFWNCPTLGGTADYFNTCSSTFGAPYNVTGYQMPCTGNAYIGFSVYPGYEYAQSQLRYQLSAGHVYETSFYVSVPNKSLLCIENISLVFSDTSTDTLPTPIFTHPDVTNTAGILSDTLNWIRVCGMYTAIGDERYIIIGNFNTNSETNYANCGYGTMPGYLLLDDVSVREVWPADTITICRGDSVNINNSWCYAEGFYSDTLCGNPETIYLKFNDDSTCQTIVHLPDEPVFLYGFTYLHDTLISFSFMSRLGCDSIHTVTIFSEMEIYEPKVQTLISQTTPLWYIEFLQATDEVKLYDALGKVVGNYLPEQFPANLNALSSGTYVWCINRSGKIFRTGKLVVCP